jgi:hypothetical protein
MFVIRLPNGNLQVPATAVHTGDSRFIGDVYIEIGPDDTDYARLAEHALTPDQVEERKHQWRAGDAALLREFQEFARLVKDDYWPGQEPEADQRLGGRAVPRVAARPAEKAPARMPRGGPQAKTHCRPAAGRAPRIRGTVGARRACGCW